MTSKELGPTDALLTEESLRNSHVPVRSRWGRLFGVAPADREKARRRLLATLEEEHRATGPQHRPPAPTDRPKTTTTATAAERPARTQGGPGDQLGYRGPVACNAAGITYRQLDYWARTGLVEPSVRSASGHVPRLYSFGDILLLRLIKRLLDAGISLQQVRTAIRHLRSRASEDLTHVTLMSDGQNVYECTSPEEVIDLIQGGRAVFGVALGGIAEEISAVLNGTPRERAAAEGEAPSASSAAAPSESKTLTVLSEGEVALQVLQKLLGQLDQRQSLAVAELLTDLQMKDQVGELAEVIDMGARRENRAGA
jgi:DNA-binding transcriptional MerR regulator